MSRGVARPARTGWQAALARIACVGVAVAIATAALAAFAAYRLAAPELDAKLVVARIADPGLREASGLAASSRRADLLWAIGDSGNPPVLHAVGTDGRLRGLVRLEDVPDVDWEDLAAFEWGGRPWLLVADVGDNRASRPEVRLHVVAEPDAAALSPARTVEARTAWTLAVRYPDGPADCEAVAVDATEERIYLLTKRLVPPRLYSVPLRPESAAPITARREAVLSSFPRPRIGAFALPVPTGRYRGQPTGMSFARDGSAAAVLTYGQVYRYPRAHGESWAAALSKVPDALGAPGLRQAEAIAFSRRGDAILVTGEERNPPLLRFAVASSPSDQ